MYINPQPRKFNVRFKPEELMIVKSAINMHIHNPGTPKNRVKVGESMLKRLEACGTSEEYTTSKIEFILFGLRLMKSEQHKELIEKTILSLSNAIKPSTSYSYHIVVDKKEVMTKEVKDCKPGDKIICIDNNKAAMHLKINHVYTVSRVSQSGLFVYLRETESHWDTMRFKCCEIEG